MSVFATSSAVRQASLYATVIIATAWAILRAGPQKLFHVDFDLQRAQAWPLDSLPALQQYTQESALSPFLVQLFNIKSVNGYLGLHFATCFLAILLLCVAQNRVHVSTKAIRIQALRILVLSPVIYLLFKTIGSSDPFTVLTIALMMIAWVSSRRGVMIATGVLAGLQHFEQTAIGVLVLLVLRHLASRALPVRLQSASSPIWLLLGVVLGKVGLGIFLMANGAPAGSGRLVWVLDPQLLLTSLSGSLNFFPVLLFTFFAGAWGVVIFYGMTVCSRQTAFPLTVALVVPAVLAVAAFDHTRVFILMTLPLLMVAIAVVAEHSEGATPRRTLHVAEILVWVITPLLLFTSPDGPTFIFDSNILDHWFMTLSRLTNGGWG